MEFTPDTLMISALVFGAITLYLALAWIRRLKGGSRRPEYVGKVSRLLLYPVKSARELADMNTVRLTKLGLKYRQAVDRHWMVTKPDGNFYSLLMNGRLTLIIPSYHDGNVHLDSAGMNTLVLPTDPDIVEENIKTVILRNTTMVALDCGDAAATWICTVLQGDGLRLHYSAPSLVKRRSCTVKKFPWATEVKPDEEIAFHEFVNCMVLTDGSMDDLNKRLAAPVSCVNFRPNIMVDGPLPYQEDTWTELYIGATAHLRYVDNCVRCPIVAVDPDTGARDKVEDPLTELKKFRCYELHGTRPTMGIYFAIIAEGDVKVGDPVYAVRRR